MTAYTIIPDHSIHSTAQGMAQVLHAGEYLHRVIGNDNYSHDWRVQFYVSPMLTPDQRSTSSDGIS